MRCGCSSMVEQQPSKLNTRVRFPSPAPAQTMQVKCKPVLASTHLSVIASASEATQGFRGTSTAATHQPPRLLRRNAPRNDGDVCVQLPLTVIASVSEATQGFRDTSTAAIPETPGLLRRFAPRNDGAGDALLAMTARGMRSLQLRRGDALLPMTARCCASPNCGA